MKLSTLLLSISLLVIFAELPGHIDCIEQSHHLTQKFDNKEYHLVKDCECDCGKGENKILPGTGQCVQCKHFRTPRPIKLVTSDPALLVNIKALKKASAKKLSARGG